MAWLERIPPSLGLYVGPACWLVSTQLNYSLAASICGWGGSTTIGVIALVLALLSLCGAAFAWRGWRAAPAGRSVEASDSHYPAKFLAGMGVITGLLFAAVIALQGSAAFFLEACAR
jgi:hypothetical protein